MTRLIPTVVYPKSEAGADPMPHGELTIVDHFMVPGGARSQEELARALKEEREISGIQDICRRFNVRMEAEVRDPEGKMIHLSIPVKDENSFTPNGMTQDPNIFKWYVGARTYEDIQRYMSEHGIQEINEEQVAGLERLASYIQEAEQRCKEAEKHHDH